MDIDSNVYHTVEIGTQVWMVENLKTTRFRDGSPIPNVTDNTTWDNITTIAYCDYSNNPNNSITYGRLYNWYVVQDNRQIAPVGWHVPTDADWTILSDYLGGENIAGGKMKEADTTHWLSPNYGATNESGFTALPGGVRGYNTGFSYLGWGAMWWSSDQNTSTNACGRSLSYTTANIYIISSYMGVGNSIRCVKD